VDDGVFGKCMCPGKFLYCILLCPLSHYFFFFLKKKNRKYWQL
jgi:hypothetical protein